MSKWLSLGTFVVLTLGIGLVIGIVAQPGEWYAALNKPFFSPPNWIFAPVWTTLYIMIGVAGWLTWTHQRDSHSMRLWFMQIALNFVWSPVFFGLHLPALALIVIIITVFAIIAFIITSWKNNIASALIFVPYLAWTSFATALNMAIVVLN